MQEAVSTTNLVVNSEEKMYVELKLEGLTNTGKSVKNTA